MLATTYPLLPADTQEQSGVSTHLSQTHILSVLLLTIAIAVSACDNNPVDHHVPLEPGYALTFDDAYVSEWYGLREILASYDARATFFVTRFDQLADSDITMLSELEQAGHEIGSHSVNHLNPVAFLENASAEEYIAQEVTPSLNLMRQNGFDPVSFAYPFGENTPELDRLVLEHVGIVRDITDVQRTVRTIPVAELDEVFCGENSTRVVTGLGIDSVFKVSVEEMGDAFARAASRNQVIVLYAHRPTGTPIRPYDCDIAYLSTLLELAKEHGLRSYTMRELNRR